jgi:hypothetical protein
MINLIDIALNFQHFADAANDLKDSDLFITLIQVAAYITPYFLIPATFKFGLGVFGNLAGMINDKSRGLFDKQRKYRQGKRAKNWDDFKSGTGQGFGNWRQNSAFRRVGTSVGSGWEGRYGFGQRGAQARSQIAGLAAQEKIMKDPRWSQINEYDEAQHALTYGSRSAAIRGLMTDRGLSRDEAERASAAAAASVGFGRSQAIAAAQQLATTGTGYKDMEDQIKTIARATGGDKSAAASIAGYNNFISKQKGRHDLAPGAGTLIEAVQQRIDGTTPAKSPHQLTEHAWNSGSLYSIANGKSAATKNFANHWKQELIDASTSGDEGRLLKAAAAVNEFKAMQPNASGENSNIINDLLNDSSVKGIMEAERQEIKPVRVRDPNDPTKFVWQNRATISSIADAAQPQARTYERPDPHNLQ